VRLEPLYRLRFRSPEAYGSEGDRCDDERYRRLNEGVCAVAGEVRREPGRRGAEVVLDVAEVVWEPLDGTMGA
jgi:hypothetical protein